MKKGTMWAALLLAGATLAGCGAGGNTTGGTSGAAANTAQNAATGGGAQQETILVGADTTFPPFESMQNGQVQGFDIELVQDIAKVENLKIEQIKTMPFEGLIPALQSDQVDVAVAGFTIKKSRMEKVNFSNAYYKSGLSILVKKGSDIKGLDDLKSKIVATKKGTSSVDLLKKSGVTNIKQFDNIDQAYSALESGGADAVVFDNPVNINFKNQHGDVEIVGGLLTGEYYGIAVTKDKPDLLQKINDGLQKLQQDGTYEKLFDKYLGGDKAGLVEGVKTPDEVALNS
ncbi:basic amino acid ABC transporter substrate-binding protein [Alicyclobacillus sp.]|uniref:basic amino acid ABC transporter substrate-binding protein n=1 Tax=Alicyclobacillus sp. TaxID=61169 RepID=UPI0025C73384|nr:basic amino acid ABC transporter substrate-binding protein [Alicyclobacillus sp.]MCL6516617.1 basic amino acid ABC transporter substrate-binding protein [Alicyclobacillus sp.]